MGKTEGGTKVREVFLEAVMHIEGSDTGGSGLPNYLQHLIVRIVKGDSTGSMWTPGGT